MVKKNSPPRDRHPMKHDTGAVKPLPKKSGNGKGGWGTLQDEIELGKEDFLTSQKRKSEEEDY